MFILFAYLLYKVWFIGRSKGPLISLINLNDMGSQFNFSYFVGIQTTIKGNSHNKYAYNWPEYFEVKKVFKDRMDFDIIGKLEICKIWCKFLNINVGGLLHSLGFEDLSSVVDLFHKFYKQIKEFLE